MTRHLTPSRLLGAMILSLAFAVACGGAERDESGAVVSAGTVDVFSLRIGDCFDDPSGEVIYQVDAVPCAEPHDNEVYALFDVHDPGSWPGEASIESDAWRGCLNRFDAYAGISYDRSQLDIAPIYPTKSSWSEGDREVVCILYDLSFAKLSGSMVGAGY